MEYCYSTDEENFTGSFDTREAAAEAGRIDALDSHEDGETFTIWTAESHRCASEEFIPDDDRLGEFVVEHMTEQAAEVWDGAEFPDVSREDERDLGQRLFAVVKAWVAEKCPTSGIWRCEEVKAHEFKAVPS